MVETPDSKGLLGWQTAWDVGRQWLDVVAKSQSITAQFLSQNVDASAFTPIVPDASLRAFSSLFESMLRDPTKLANAQADLWRRHGELFQHILNKSRQSDSGGILPPVKDRRFKNDEWDKNLALHALMHSYLIGTNWLKTLVADQEHLSPLEKKNVAFFTNQFIDAVAPTNNPLTNPDVMKKTVESGGANLVAGFRNLLSDLASGAGHIRRADDTAFELGRNIAATQGSVILRTEMMELIQYEPTTPKVGAIPLLLTPPWVNKYYLFDLQKKSSFIRWAVGEGFTVFAISWVNPDESHAKKDFENYWFEGPMAAFDAIEKISGQRHVNLFGYCLGGTLTASGLAYLAAGEDSRVTSATLVATMTDFADFGDFEVFVTEEQVNAIEKYVGGKKYLDSSDLSRLFSLLRANDLIWSSAISSYLLAEGAVASDLLFWFSDGVGMPGKMLDTFMRRVILDNALIRPGALSFRDTPLDLQKIQTPLYFVSLKDDHVAAWESTYNGARRFAAPKTFILGGSGHNAGTINPPAAGKHGYWTNPEFGATPEAWLSGAERHEGSWWTAWSSWLRGHSGREVNAKSVAAGPLPILEAAPGSYARTRR